MAWNQRTWIKSKQIKKKGKCNTAAIQAQGLNLYFGTFCSVWYTSGFRALVVWAEFSMIKLEWKLNWVNILLQCSSSYIIILLDHWNLTYFISFYQFVHFNLCTINGHYLNLFFHNLRCKAYIKRLFLPGSQLVYSAEMDEKSSKENDHCNMIMLMRFINMFVCSLLYPQTLNWQVKKFCF